MGKRHLVPLATALLLAQPALASGGKEQSLPPPEVYQQLINCRTVADSAQRLSCYDHQTEVFDEAMHKREIVISDKNAIKTARRGLFGFAAPIGRLMGFGGDDDEAEQIKEVETTVTGVRRGADGWRLDFEDGSTWEQNDTRDFALSPKVGNPVRITRGMLGTYFISVQGQRAIKMRRVK